jgi:hypothetical protein
MADKILKQISGKVRCACGALAAKEGFGTESFRTLRPGHMALSQDPVIAKRRNRAAQLRTNNTLSQYK